MVNSMVEDKTTRAGTIKRNRARRNISQNGPEKYFENVYSMSDAPRYHFREETTDTPDTQVLTYESKGYPNSIQIPIINLEANEGVKVIIKKSSNQKNVDIDSGNISVEDSYTYTKQILDSLIELKKENELILEKNLELINKNTELADQNKLLRKEKDEMNKTQSRFEDYKFHSKIWIFTVFLMGLFLTLGLTGILGIFPSITGVLAAITGGIGAYINWKEKEYES